MELKYIKNDIKREHGLIVCPYNGECRCERMECGNCGWNPRVAQERAGRIIPRIMAMAGAAHK